MTPDFINGGLEFASAALTLVNIRRLVIDKHVAGVSLIASALYDFWGFWNCYYYPSLDQWWSFAGGSVLVVGNIWWTVLAVYYTRRKPKLTEAEIQARFDAAGPGGLVTSDAPFQISSETIARYAYFKARQMG